jgi:hypothetical protein
LYGPEGLGSRNPTVLSTSRRNVTESIDGMFRSVIIEQMNVVGAKLTAAIWSYILPHLMPSDVAVCMEI